MQACAHVNHNDSDEDDDVFRLPTNALAIIHLLNISNNFL